MDKNKNIIITGGTDGIGLAAVEQLLEYNNNIFIVGKNAEKGNKEFDQMKKALREAKSMKSKSEAFNFHIESCQTLGNVK